MFVEAISTAELLSAYVIGDVNHDERTAVEQWLKTDPAARTLLAELRELCARLKASQIEASSSLANALRQAVENIPTISLISAYAVGDIAPSERAEVQRLLDTSPQSRTLVHDLRALCERLKAGQSVASESIADTLRDAVHDNIHATPIQALVVVSVTGDVSASEQRDVQTYCATHPEAAAEQRQMAAMSLLLNAGQRVASPTRADELRQRLAAALPVGAMVPKAIIEAAKPVAKIPEKVVIAPVAQATTPTPSGRMPASSQSGRLQERPSLRVFVARENPWKKRAWVIGSVAAAVALAFGLREIVISKGSTGPRIASGTTTSPSNQADHQNSELTDNRTIVPGHDAPVVKAVPEQGPYNPNLNKTPDGIVHEGPTRPPKAPGDETVAPAPIIVDGKIRDVKNPDATPTGTSPVVNPNTPAAPEAPVATRNDIPPTIPVTDPNVKVVKNSNGGGGVSSGSNTNNAVAQGTSILPPQVPTPTPPTPVPTNDNNKIPPQEGAGVVGVVKGTGLAQATTPSGAVMVLKTQGEAIPSGSTIVTDDAHLSLVLPGNGRLYISRFANLKVNFSRNTTVVTLNNGELYFIAPPGGSLTVNAVKATASRIVEGDVSLAAGKLTALNFSTSPLTLTATKQSSIQVTGGVQASAAADASAPPKRDNPVTLTGLWRTDVLISGDGIKALIKRK